MGFLAPALRFISENRPDLLAGLPGDVLRGEGQDLLRRGQIYDYEQLNKARSLASDEPRELVVRQMYAALRECRIDDFCFLFGRIGGSFDVDRSAITSACDALLRRGNVAGLEAVVRATGVSPVIRESSAYRAYDVLVATGRTGAIDYVRQLSGLDVKFSPEALLLGYRIVLLGARFEALRELAAYAPRPPGLHPDEIERAMRRALDDIDISGAATLSEILEHPCPLSPSDVPALLERAREAGRFSEIPTLFSLVRGADPALLSPSDVSGVLRANDPAGVRLLYSTTALRPWLTDHEEAYRTAVERLDRVATRLVCEVSARPIDPLDGARLLESALLWADDDWIQFALRRGPLPEVRGEYVSAFRFQVARRSSAADPDILAALPGDDGARDLDVGRFVLALRDGRFEEAVLAAPALGSASSPRWAQELCGCLEAAERAKQEKRRRTLGLPRS